MSETQEVIEWVENHPAYRWDDARGERGETAVQEPYENKQGNTVTVGFAPDVSGDRCRYFYDFGMCSKGWRQYDTDQDASYYGIWVHMGERMVFSYVEGDLCLVECPTPESFKAELDSMAEFHGDPPPFAKSFDFSDDKPPKLTGITHYFDNRPSSDEVQA